MLAVRNVGALVVRASPSAQRHTSYSEYKVCSGEMEPVGPSFCHASFIPQEGVMHSTRKTKKFYFF